jgi:hypothetical protein
MSSSAIGPFEKHMFDKMGDTVIARIFMAGAVRNPDSKRNRMHLVNTLGYDSYAVIKSSCSYHGRKHTRLFYFFNNKPDFIFTMRLLFGNSGVRRLS